MRVGAVSFLYADYKPAAWWYELFVMGRKLFMSGVLVFVYEGTATQIVVAELVADGEGGVDEGERGAVHVVERVQHLSGGERGVGRERAEAGREGRRALVALAGRVDADRRLRCRRVELLEDEQLVLLHVREVEPPVLVRALGVEARRVGGEFGGASAE